jgi:hypothetical protein
VKNPVHKFEDGKWYFWNYANTIRRGPFEDRRRATFTAINYHLLIKSKQLPCIFSNEIEKVREEWWDPYGPPDVGIIKIDNRTFLYSMFETLSTYLLFEIDKADEKRFKAAIRNINGPYWLYVMRTHKPLLWFKCDD